MLSGEIEPIRAENYEFLQQHVHAASGILIGQDKHYLFECRLAPIVSRLGLHSVNDLCNLLRGTREAEIGREVAEVMTINETYFFRDPAQYDAVRDRLLPALKEECKHSRRLRFWSAAASTGQEAYSLAITLLEAGFGDWDIEILGTDLSSSVLDRARAGHYRQIEVNRGMPATLLVKYFTRAGVTWKLNDNVRRMVRFEKMDLRNSVGGNGQFQLIFCRNVLIYFDPVTRSGVIDRMHKALLPGKWLYFGGAEAYAGLDTWFQRECVGDSIVYVARKESACQR